MLSESVRDYVYDSPVDIQSLGCVVVDMVTGKPTRNELGLEKKCWKFSTNYHKTGQIFLRKCLVKDPVKRWMAVMLMEHPFIRQDGEKESLPRTHFDFPYWVSSEVAEIQRVA
ncbi:hypothetical protein K1719_001289 [Acacia pycnantha]|nr:hypothetical protein K1719_001289 [Acacia pycnantha]